MGTKYTTQSITGYDASPPPDDGTTGSDNKVTWAKHKTKLAGPIKTLAEAVNTAMVNFVDWATTSKADAYTTAADDDNRVIECTSSPTITLGAPGTMGSGYTVTIKCVSGTTTVNTGGNDVDGSASNRSIAAGGYETYRVNAAAGDWLLVTEDKKTLTSPVINTGVSGSAVIDDDSGATVTDTTLWVGESIKAYVDSLIPGAIETYREGTGVSFGNATLEQFTHGLSAKPDIVQLYIKCTDVGGDQGYAQNDEVLLFNAADNTNATGIGVYWDATDVYVRLNDRANPFQIAHKTTGNVQDATATKWEMYCNAIYFGSTVTQA